MTLITRDSFARAELHRTTFNREESGAATCDWCDSKNQYGGLFQYYIETDSGSKHEIDGLFCCIGCMKSYNE